MQCYFLESQPLMKLLSRSVLPLIASTLGNNIRLTFLAITCFTWSFDSKILRWFYMGHYRIFTKHAHVEIRDWLLFLPSTCGNQVKCITERKESTMQSLLLSIIIIKWLWKFMFKCIIILRKRHFQISFSLASRCQNLCGVSFKNFLTCFIEHWEDTKGCSRLK